MACVSSQLPDDPPAKPNVLAVLVRYRFAFATRCSKCSRCSSLPARRLRALLLALPTPFCEKMRPSPYILGLETQQGPLFSHLHNRSRIATHRTAPPSYPVPSLPNPSVVQPKATLSCSFSSDRKNHPRRTRVALCVSSPRFVSAFCAAPDSVSIFTLLSWYQLCFASSGTVTCSLMHACKLPTLRSL